MASVWVCCQSALLCQVMVRMLCFGLYPQCRSPVIPGVPMLHSTQGISPSLEIAESHLDTVLDNFLRRVVGQDDLPEVPPNLNHTVTV